jgi:hypothetical protein
MNIKIPKTFMGKPVAGSLEKVLLGLNGNPINPLNPQVQPPVNAPNLSGYIYVPSIGLYLAKQRTHLRLNWNQTHEELQKENLRMPTIPQFLEYLKFLQNGYQDRSEALTILDDVLKVGNWRSEWLDAKFDEINGQMVISYNHRIVNNVLKAQNENEVLLPDYLKEDCWADIFGSANVQGLSTRKLGSSYEQGKNAYFWFPRSGRVAWFDADSGRAGLDCNWDPANSYSSLGVFACAEGAAP